MKRTPGSIRTKGTITLNLTKAVRDKLIRKKEQINTYAHQHSLSPIKDKVLYEWMILRHGKMDYGKFAHFRNAQLKLPVKEKEIIVTTVDLNGKCRDILYQYWEQVREHTPLIGGRQPSLKDVYNYIFFSCNLTVKTFFDE